MTTSRKKLIEVAIPLKAINEASAKEKSIRHGHPSTLHLWWARRPLAAARAVIFAQMVDDPSSCPDLFPTAKAQDKERQRLFKILEDLVLWENTSNEKVLQAARDEIWQSWRRACAENSTHPKAKELFDRAKLPGFHDPFAGGGALPLEAQRLGLEAHASDLNPVAVLLNKAMIEIPPKFADRSPVNPQAKAALANAGAWRGAQGLADDVKYYGHWMLEEARKRIGSLYQPITVTEDLATTRKDLAPLVGRRLPVVAWIWARTVKSPNPAFSGVDVPLASTFFLSNKKGSEAWVEPVVEGQTYRLEVKVGVPPSPKVTETGTKLARANFRCLLSGSPIPGDYIKAEGKAGRLGARLMGVVAGSDGGRVYLSPTDGMERLAQSATPSWIPEGDIPPRLTGGTCVPYGLAKWGDIFTQRQLVALSTFADLVNEARARVRQDCLQSGMIEGEALEAGGAGAAAYSDAVAVYLALSTDRLADRNSSLCGWDLAQAGRGREATVRNVFARQALPMVWDFAEVNILADTAGSFDSATRAVVRVLERLSSSTRGRAEQVDAATQSYAGRVVSTDPPYYDNISYADLSDFFYVWLRRTLKPVLPTLFSTLAVPKAQELIASMHRHGSKEKAESFFLNGMTQAMHRLAEQAHPGFPVTIYYAFKQSETESAEGTSSTGWETFLDAVIQAGFGISGTWPIRTELGNRLVGSGSNALASSIVLVCRPKAPKVLASTRRDFVAALKAELPHALRHLQRGNIAPVDLAQAAIGPGMAVYTRFDKVLDSDGRALPVRDALALINQVLDEALAEQEGDFDADSRWALAWHEQSGFAEGEFGVADVLARAKNTAVAGLVEAGILSSSKGKVRLLKPDELPADWDPTTDTRLTAWEVVHHLIRALNSGGELAAAAIVLNLGGKAETARELAYRLYTLCERKKRAQEALAYNGLVQSWPEITRLAREGSKPKPGAQGGLFDKDGE